MSNLLDQTLEAIRVRQASAQAQGVQFVGVFGSVARGEASDGSDIDVAYEVVGKASLFDVGGILMDLQEALGHQVDMVDLAHVKPRLRVLMERDLVRV